MQFAIYPKMLISAVVSSEEGGDEGVENDANSLPQDLFDTQEEAVRYPGSPLLLPIRSITLFARFGLRPYRRNE